MEVDGGSDEITGFYLQRSELILSSSNLWSNAKFSAKSMTFRVSEVTLNHNISAVCCTVGGCPFSQQFYFCGSFYHEEKKDFENRRA